MNQEDLEEARDILAKLKAAYKEHIEGRAMTRRYRIKDREMEFHSPSELLKQIKHWEHEITRLEVAAGIRPAPPHRIVVRF